MQNYQLLANEKKKNNIFWNGFYIADRVCYVAYEDFPVVFNRYIF